jgi:hypothetical protein
MCFIPLIASVCTHDSASEFAVFPKTGKLEPASRDGTSFIVSYTPVVFYGEVIKIVSSICGSGYVPTIQATQTQSYLNYFDNLAIEHNIISSI